MNHRALSPPFIALVFLAIQASIPGGPSEGVRSPQHAAPVVAKDSTARLHRIAEGVYAILHDDPVLSFPDGAIAWPHGNTGVIVGGEAVLVIDSPFYPGRATADIALIRAVTDKPVRYLTNTHGHPDHALGNAAYRRAYPALEIVGARGNAEMAPLLARFTRRVLSDGSLERRTLEGHERSLASGADSTGRALTRGHRMLLRRTVEQERAWLREFASAEVAGPTLLFDDVHEIDLGGRTVELRARGAMHTAADVIAWLPRERILFTGDLLAAPIPYIYGVAHPRRWVRELREFESLSATAIVPGHGPVFADASYVRLTRELFETAIDRMERLVQEGRTPLEARAALDLEDFRSRFLEPGSPNAAVWDLSVKVGLAESIRRCLADARC